MSPPENRKGRYRDRIVAGHALLIILPRRSPGAPWELLVADLEISRSAFFRLIADLRAAGYVIESQALTDGRRGYYLNGASEDLLRRLGLAPPGRPPT